MDEASKPPRSAPKAPALTLRVPLLVNVPVRPTELFRRQVWATFEEDRLGVALIDHIGPDNVMWASDYPHPDSTFPYSRRAVADMFRDVDPAVMRKVVAENCARLYGLGR